MGKLAPTDTFQVATGQPIGARDGVGGPHLPPGHLTFAPHATVAPPTRVLICVGDAGVRELMGLLLVDAGCEVTSMDVLSWIGGEPIPEPSPEVLILDAWPLRHMDAATQASARLAAQPAAVVLLIDRLQPAQLAAQLGAVATLPLLFTLPDLICAVQQGMSARTKRIQAAGSWEYGI